MRIQPNTPESLGPFCVCPPKGLCVLLPVPRDHIVVPSIPSMQYLERRATCTIFTPPIPKISDHLEIHVRRSNGPFQRDFRVAKIHVYPRSSKATISPS